jgi:hypothetical protein
MNSNKDYIDGLLDALKLANKIAYGHYFNPYTEAKIIALSGFERAVFDLIKMHDEKEDK